MLDANELGLSTYAVQVIVLFAVGGIFAFVQLSDRAPGTQLRAVYGGPSRVERAFRDLEVIVVDDGSSDRVLQILGEWPVSKIFILASAQARIRQV
jgi:hypothetical protein